MEEARRFHASRMPEACAANSGKRRVPDIIHFIFGLGDAPEQFLFCWYAAVLSAQLANRPERIVFHYHHEPHGPWWEKTKCLPSIMLRHHASVPVAIGSKKIEKRAHRADILRLLVLLEEGGVYMDIDTITARPYASLLVGDPEFVIGLQAPEDPPHGRLCNAVMLAAPGSAFVRAWVDAYEEHFNPGGWGEASVDLPYRLSEELGPDRCHIVPTETFLWPPWYRIRQIFQADMLVPDGLVTLHLWAKISGPFLETVEGFEWADRNPRTLYGRLLQRLQAWTMLGAEGAAAIGVSHVISDAAASGPLPLAFPAVD